MDCIIIEVPGDLLIDFFRLSVGCRRVCFNHRTHQPRDANHYLAVDNGILYLFDPSWIKGQKKDQTKSHSNQKHNTPNSQYEKQKPYFSGVQAGFAPILYIMDVIVSW